MQTIKQFVDFMISAIDNFEHLAIVIVSRIAPWAAPLAPAYFVARTVQRHFNSPIWVAVAVAITVEAVGIAATHITLVMYQYNQTKRKNDPEAPFDIGVLAASAYFIVGISLTVILEVVPSLVIIAPAAFFLMAIVAYITLALMSDHARLIDSIKVEKTERKEKRQSRRKRTGTIPATDHGSWPEIGETTKERARAILAEHSGISGSELGRQLGRSERLGRMLKAEIEAEMPANGNDGRG